MNATLARTRASTWGSKSLSFSETIGSVNSSFIRSNSLRAEIRLRNHGVLTNLVIDAILRRNKSGAISWAKPTTESRYSIGLPDVCTSHIGSAALTNRRANAQRRSSGIRSTRCSSVINRLNCASRSTPTTCPPPPSNLKVLQNIIEPAIVASCHFEVLVKDEGSVELRDAY